MFAAGVRTGAGVFAGVVAGRGDGVAAGVVPVFAFAAGVAFGVGVALGVGVGVTGTGQSSIPLGCIMQFGSVMNGLWPCGTWITWPPGGIAGAPAGGTPPFAHGL